MSFPLWASSLGRWRFSVRSYCGREERQVPLRFPSASAPVSLHKFSRASKIWVSRSWLDSTLALTSICPQFCTCTKNGQPCRRSSIELHKEGKRIERLSERRNKLVWLCRAIVKCAKRSRTQTFQAFQNYERVRTFQEDYQVISW